MCLPPPFSCLCLEVNKRLEENLEEELEEKLGEKLEEKLETKLEKNVEGKLEEKLEEKTWFLVDSRCSFYKVSMFDNVNFKISSYLYHATGDCEKQSYS